MHEQKKVVGPSVTAVISVVKVSVDPTLMSTPHAHNISTNLFYQGSAPPRSELQSLSRTIAVFPQT